MTSAWPPPPGRAALAHWIRGRLGPAPELERTPLVSIVVLSHDGRRHLERLLPGLRDCTDYPSLELILVDNASTDGSAELAVEADLGFPVTTIRNESNVPFSDGCGQGVERSNGEYLLFLNNDIELFDPAWLTELVARLQTAGGGAVGATLLHGEDSAGGKSRGHSLQHHGVRFRRQRGFVVPVNVGEGSDPSPFLGVDRPCMAVTAACMLVDRVAFDRVGGFTTGFRWGWEDVDIGLKLAAAGFGTVCSGRAVALHHESSTRFALGGAFRRANRAVNERLFRERWGPVLQRGYGLDLLTGGGLWSDVERPQIALVLDDQSGDCDRAQAAELGEALEHRGWGVTYLHSVDGTWPGVPQDADCVLLLAPGFAGPLPPSALVAAWIRGRVGDWLAGETLRVAELVLVSSVEDLLAVETMAGGETHLFPPATNPSRFRSRPGPRHGLLDLSSEQVAYADLPDLLAAAAVVIGGARVVGGHTVDALASGAVAVTDAVADARVLFDEEFPTGRSREEIEDQAKGLMRDAERRRKLQRRYRAVVLTRHTWDRRAEELAALICARIERSRFVLPFDAPKTAGLDDLRSLLEARGVPCLPPEVDHPAAATADVALCVDPRSHTRPAQLNVLLCVAPSIDLDGADCAFFDVVLVDSEVAAARLQPLTTAAVAVLPGPAQDRAWNEERVDALIAAVESRAAEVPLTRHMARLAVASDQG